MKNSLNIWILIFIVMLALFIWNYTMDIKNNESFEQPKTNWIETLKCLNFNDDDLNKFQKYLSSGEDPQVLLNKLMYMADQKKLKDNEIFECLT